MTLLGTLFAGIVGTLLMSLVMAGITRSGWANADMIRALGSFVTGRLEGAFWPGFSLHLLSGMLFAIPYAVLLGALARHGFLMTLGLGALLGLGHGFVMSLILLAVVAERHPIPKFREAGAEVAVAHIFGHLAYGLGVAATVVLLGIDWGLKLGS